MVVWGATATYLHGAMILMGYLSSMGAKEHIRGDILVHHTCGDHEVTNPSN